MLFPFSTLILIESTNLNISCFFTLVKPAQLPLFPFIALIFSFLSATSVHCLNNHYKIPLSFFKERTKYLHIKQPLVVIIITAFLPTHKASYFVSLLPVHSLFHFFITSSLPPPVFPVATSSTLVVDTTRFPH